jgi:hypothetical protein
MPDIEQLYREGVAAIRAGDKATGREKLKVVLQQNNRHEQAWLWLSAAVESDAERVSCLKNVLKLNPDNEAAQRGLEKLGVSPPPVPPPPTPPPVPSFSAPPAAEPAPAAPPPIPDPPLPGLAQRSTAPAGGAARVEPEEGPEAWRRGLVSQTLPDEAQADALRATRPVRAVTAPAPDESRNILDLFDAWVAALIFRQQPLIEEIAVASPGRVAVNILFALIVAGLGTFLQTMLATSLVGDQMTEELQILVETLAEAGVTTNFDQILTVASTASAFGAIIGVIITALVFSTIVHVVARSLMGGTGTYIQTLHAMTIAQVVIQIVGLIPALLLFLAPSSVGNVVRLVVGLYGLAVTVMAISSAHEGFGIGKSLLTWIISFVGAAVFLCLFGFCLFSILGALGSTL